METGLFYKRALKPAQEECIIDGVASPSCDVSKRVNNLLNRNNYLAILWFRLRNKKRDYWKRIQKFWWNRIHCSHHHRFVYPTIDYTEDGQRWWKTHYCRRCGKEVSEVKQWESHNLKHGR